MRKFKTKNGYVAYKTTVAEIMRTGGFGICDECGTHPPESGYLVPVLNHWQCEACFNDFQENVGFYPEDLPYERSRAAYYESMIPVTEEEQPAEKKPSVELCDLIKTAQFNKETPSLKLLPCRKCGSAAILTCTHTPNGNYIASVVCSGPQVVNEHGKVFAKHEEERVAKFCAVTIWNDHHGRKEPPNE